MSFVEEKLSYHTSNNLNLDSSKILESIKMPDLIAILTIGIGTWYALLNIILDFSDYSESPLILLGLSVIHYVNTVMIVCCLISLYYSTVSISGLNDHYLYRLSKINNYCIKIIKLYWLPILTFCGIEYLILSFTNDKTDDWAFSILVGLTLLITTILFCYLFKISRENLFRYIFNRKNINKTIVTSVISYLLFCVVMTLIFSKVGYKFEKEYYRKTENPILLISRRGYIFKPSIKSIRFENLNTLVTSNTISKFIEIDPQLIKENGGYILLTYSIQIVEIQRELQIEAPFLDELKN
ncbi:hypothetical protein [Sphingobacterium multivorum]|uniref:hypothetical protein n=1 Tax=Sphingobacterium multivorum TaxID=28454 RepID=UPI0028B1B90D|nr:hypothetical protein [Sphingobacterium multivorum]